MNPQRVTVAKFISILQRNTKRYFDTALETDPIGSGQHFFLLRIYENEGITMYDLARQGNFDKGTVTKAVQKMAELGYIRMETDARDRRIRHLYVTEEAMPFIRKIYRLRNDWQEKLFAGFSQEEAERCYRQLERMAENSCEALQ